MKKVTRLFAAATLTVVLAFSAVAGELQTPPCAQPLPGELQTPPCTADVLLDDPAPAITEPDASTTTLLTEAAIDILESLLTLY